MKITILSIFPEMFAGFLDTSIIKKARLKGLVEYELVDIRSFSKDKHNRVDDYSFGGGAGMVFLYQPVVDALAFVKTPKSHVIMMAPAGYLFKQKRARELKEYEHLILICGHYEGFDERILQHVDEVLCIGDYVLTGGELAAMVVADAVTRLVDGVIAEDSPQEESFENGLLEYPQYTRPDTIDGFTVPEVLLSGHHEKIAQWRRKESLRKTWKYRPELLEKIDLDKKDRQYLEEIVLEEDKV
ncbi:MAG: tRNA (guanosine(37)-N1)-methyltransferase TrmD [Erysipelotrichaceae bacterium]|jgi:tRNA (guanine37-N1)-methyltransferase|nr:tRNA (guanosine(37)-N1)-methyltransferase TrmD [Erysipelotrichaceae bacterium]